MSAGISNYCKVVVAVKAIGLSLVWLATLFMFALSASFWLRSSTQFDRLETTTRAGTLIAVTSGKQLLNALQSQSSGMRAARYSGTQPDTHPTTQTIDIYEYIMEPATRPATRPATSRPSISLRDQ